MRVLQVIPAIAARYGGPSAAVLSYARALERWGIDCLVLTTDADGFNRLPVSIGRVLRWQGANVQFCRRRFGEAFKYSESLSAWLRKHATDFDLLHVHSIFSHSSVVASRACAAQGIPYVVRPHGSLDPFSLDRKKLRKRLFMLAWGKSLLENAAAIHYGTDRERELVESTHQLGQGFVIPPGIEIPQLRQAGNSFDGSAKAPPLSSPYVLCMGRFDPIKNIELLIDAFAGASKCEALAPWKLVLAGDGHRQYVRTLERRVDTAGMSERIIFTGWLDDTMKNQYLSRAGLFALTSRHENFSRAAAEALAWGVPTMLTDQVFLSDLVRSHGAGWVVSQRLADVTSTLAEALLSASERRARGLAARKLAVGHLGISTTTQLLVERYREILARRAETGLMPAKRRHADAA